MPGYLNPKERMSALEYQIHNPESQHTGHNQSLNHYTKTSCPEHKYASVPYIGDKVRIYETSFEHTFWRGHITHQLHPDNEVRDDREHKQF